MSCPLVDILADFIATFQRCIESTTDIIVISRLETAIYYGKDFDFFVFLVVSNSFSWFLGMCSD